MAYLLKIIKRHLSYISLLFFLSLISLSSRILFQLNPHLIQETEFQLLTIAGIFFIGFYVNRIAPKTIIPSFVWAIFAGMAVQPLLSNYTQHLHSLTIAVELFAAIILFAGGLEIPFNNFKNWFFPITTLSLLGVIFSTLFFSFLIYLISSFFGITDPTLIPTFIILSAALASIDPTAIIPTLQSLHFRRNFMKQIAISESALTDISGSIITRFLLLALLSVTYQPDNTIFHFFLPLLDKSIYDALALQIISGIIVGYIGFSLIKYFYLDSTKQEAPESHHANDPALLLSVPILTFVLGNVLGGAGFLAAFIAGLFTERISSLRQVSHFYESFLDHLIKPFIFIILGALVPLPILLQLAPIGIIAGLIFMFVVRPFVVFISLSPWLINKKFRIGDLIFLSFIRETGIISAILLIIAAGSPLIDSEFAIAIGMWIILLTLILEPPLTPIIARKTGVAK